MRALTLRDTAFLGGLSGFSVASLNPTVWLDASDSSTIIGSGAPVRVVQWTDKSGLNFNLTQVTSVLQPSSGTNTINGKNVIYFDGARKLTFLDANLFASQFAGSIYVVASGNVSSAGNKSLFQVRTPADVARAQVIALSGAVQAGGRRLDGDLYQSVNANTISDGVPFVGGAVFDWDSARVWANLNGTLVERVGGFQTIGQISSSNDDISVGQNARNAGAAFTGSIGEIVVFRRVLTPLEHQGLSSYLRGKWGTP